MLQVIVSPAKQMRAAQDAFEVLGIPPFAHETAQPPPCALLDIERNEGSGGLQALWNVSDKLLGPCLNTLHEFGPILRNDDLDNPGTRPSPLPCCHVLSRHSIPEHGARGDGCRTARTGCKTISGSSPDSTDACGLSMASSRIGWRWARSSPSTMPETSTRFGATSSRGLSPRQAQTPRSSTSPA